MTLDNESIIKLLEQLDRESKALRKIIYKLAWHMRGSLGIDEAFEIGFRDREIINELIKDNLEITKESGWPFF